MNNDAILLIDSPADWEAKKIKYLFDERKENNDPIKTNVLVSLTHDRGVILHSDKGNIGNKEKDDLTKYKLVYPGDILTNSMNVIIGSSGLSEYYGLVSPVYYILAAKNETYDKKFFHYLFRSVVFQKSLVGLGNGILEHRMRIPMDKLGDQFIPFPKPVEQKLISRYLDKKTGQIDALIKKMRQKIELLKEKRVSLINQCITKGLDSNPPMQDSGIKWVGKIPRHWDCKKLKFVSRQISDKRSPGAGEIKISPENVESHTGKILNFYSDYETEGQIFRHGDILFNKLRVYLNKVILCEFEGLSMGEMIVIRPHSISGPFLHRVLSSSGFIQYVNSLSEGVKLPRPPVHGIFNSVVPLPPDSEQQQISKYLSKNLEAIDWLVEKNSRRIQLISEYRQSLVSSVVTGKIRVTEKMI